MGNEVSVVDPYYLEMSIEDCQDRLYWPSHPFEGPVSLAFVCSSCKNEAVVLDPYPTKWSDIVDLHGMCYQCNQKKRVYVQFIQASLSRLVIWEYSGRRADLLEKELPKFLSFGPAPSDNKLPPELAYKRYLYPCNIVDGEGPQRNASQVRAKGISEGSQAGRVLQSVIFSARSSQSSWSTGSWSSLGGSSDPLPKDFLWHPSVFELSLEERTERFKEQVKKYVHTNEVTKIKLSRDTLLVSSRDALLSLSSRKMRGTLKIKMDKEGTMDMGGVSKELLTLLTKEILDIRNGLFCDNDESGQFYPNVASGVNQDHLSYFYLLGRVVGRALITGQCIDLPLSGAMFRAMAGKPLGFTDLLTVDRALYLNIRKALCLNPQDVEYLELYFTADVDMVGTIHSYDLIPNGSEVKVTGRNRLKWAAMYSQWKMVDCVELQLLSYLEGFFDLVPVQLLAIFSCSELEKVICGMNEIDVDDWKQYTVNRCRPADLYIIEWFWNYVRRANGEKRSNLLLFVTGSIRAPVSFKLLHPPFAIRVFRALRKGSLPLSHTCFNQIDLPLYENQSEMDKALDNAIQYGATGFGIK